MSEHSKQPRREVVRFGSKNMSSPFSALSSEILLNLHLAGKRDYEGSFAGLTHYGFFKDLCKKVTHCSKLPSKSQVFCIPKLDEIVY